MPPEPPADALALARSWFADGAAGTNAEAELCRTGLALCDAVLGGPSPSTPHRAQRTIAGAGELIALDAALVVALREGDLARAAQLLRAAAAAGAGARPTVAGAAAALAVEQRADGGFGPGERGAPRAALTLTCAWALAALRHPELAGAGRQAQAQTAAAPAVSSRRKKPASRSPSTASSSTGPS